MYPVFTGRLARSGPGEVVASAFWEGTPSDYVTLNASDLDFCTLADGKMTLRGILDLLRRNKPYMGEEDVAGGMRESIRLLNDNHLVVFFSGRLNRGTPSAAGPTPSA